MTVTGVPFDAEPPRRSWTAAAYAAVLAAAVGGFLLIRSAGESLRATASGASAPHASVAGGTSGLVHLLLALVAVIALARLFAVLFRYAGQPPVIGEVVAGI